MVTKSRKPAVKTAIPAQAPVPATKTATINAPAPAPMSVPLAAAAAPILAARRVAPKRAAAKPASKAPLRPTAKPAAKSASAKPARSDKVKKPKLVRDSFTIPKSEYAVIEQLKQRAAKLGAPIKKSELLRAGIKMLATLATADYLAALAAVPTIKTGRPAKA